MSNVWNESQTDLLAPTPDPTPTTDHGRLQRIQQYLFRRRQRELLEKTRWRLAAETSRPGKGDVHTLSEVWGNIELSVKTAGVFAEALRMGCWQVPG